MATPRVTFGASLLGEGQHLRPGAAGSEVFWVGAQAHQGEFEERTAS